ncbi:MAG: hypothetical protein WC314_17970 [Vulcanimicrobiota bacterium]
MQVHQRNWTINVGGPNRGQDINREIQIQKLKRSLDATVDIFKAGDNGEYRVSIPNSAEDLVGRDLDPQPGRVLADFSEGKFIRKHDGSPLDPFVYKNKNELKAAFEFDPATGHALSYSGNNGPLNFDVAYESGQLIEIKTESTDGTYQESVKFSADGKVATFHSEQKVEEGKEADNDRTWFLSLTLE